MHQVQSCVQRKLAGVVVLPNKNGNASFGETDEFTKDTVDSVLQRIDVVSKKHMVPLVVAPDPLAKAIDNELFLRRIDREDICIERVSDTRFLDLKWRLDRKKMMEFTEHLMTSKGVSEIYYIDRQKSFKKEKTWKEKLGLKLEILHNELSMRVWKFKRMFF